MRKTVVVTDGEQRAALAVVRSLGVAGWKAIVVASDARPLAGGSRYAAREIQAPSPLQAPAEFARVIADIVAEEQAILLLPITEPSLLSLLPVRSTFAPACIPFPDAERFRLISDKALLLETASSIGIAVPTQLTLADRGKLDELREELRFPLVLKPARSIGESHGRRERLSVRHAADIVELRESIRAFSDAAFPLLLQQRVIGPGVGIFLLTWDGETYAQFAHRRLREKPPAGGVSVYRESIDANPELVAKSAALLTRFGWHGPAMIEYKIDAITGRPFLMEVNGRFWGSLQLAIDAGVDFPVLLAQLTLGERPAPVLTYRVGVRSRWWWGDVDQLLLRLRRSRAALALPADSPSRGQALLEFLALHRPGDRGEVFRWRDPRPGLRETLAWLQGK